MADARDLLIEIGCEELPPGALQKLSAAFSRGVVKGLQDAGVDTGEATSYATPRRLAVLISDVAGAQPERQIEQRGPALAQAFDADGKPTKAAEGFARSVGLDIEQLEKLETDAGSWLVFRSTEVGQSTPSLLPDIVAGALERLPIPKRMRWSDLDFEFVRPVHWIVMVYGSEVVDAEIMGIKAGNMSYGHRFHHPDPITIKDPASYASMHYSQSHVIAEFETRKEVIRSQVTQAATDLKAVAVIDDKLLNEVTALVEWPVAITGSFEERFLDLPADILIATLKHKQKCFHVMDGNGKIMPNFITVSNIDSSSPETVRKGNERVITPRLSDAAFFYQADLKRSLDERLDELKNVVFQKKLGTVHDKMQRISKLAGHFAMAMGLNPNLVKMARRAGQLAKADLLTEMVGEYPDLQGAMGGYYAQRYGEPEEVANAIAEHYKPRFAGDDTPDTPVGIALALADRFDTLTGIFSIGQAPTGDKDPFALRRAALGAMRIMIEAKLDLDPRKLLADAAHEIPGMQDSTELVAQVHGFMLDRLRAYYQDAGITADIFEAVLARKPQHPFDFDRRVRAVADFCRLPEAASLAAANKRIRNILKKTDVKLPEELDDSLFSEDAEWDLATRLVGISASVTPMLNDGDYSAALTHLAALRDPVDAFFDSVMVMTEDDAIRTNRLVLLNNLSALFMRTADISRLQLPTADT